MENLDFSNTDSMIQNIQQPPPPQAQLIVEEKKLDEPQMMEFSSSVDDLMAPVGGPPPSMPESSQDVYTNPTNGRVAAMGLPDPTYSSQKKKKSAQNPFNLTDEQFNALLAGIVAVLVFSTMVQTKLAGTVPNFSGINGNIASALLGAVVFYFAHRFIKNR